jgi:hypothetical protein
MISLALSLSCCFTMRLRTLAGWNDEVVHRVINQRIFMAHTSNCDCLQLLDESVKIHAPIVIWYVDLTSVNHRGIKLVEQKLYSEPLGIPENLK